jgi:hypothetical protein
MSVTLDFHVFCGSWTFYSLRAEAVLLIGDIKQDYSRVLKGSSLDF